MATKDNLGNAFAGESQANRKYLAFAEKAETDGYPQIAKLFRAAAAAETVHAHAHLRAMDGINSTEKNLQVAIDGEGFEFQEMYPPYLEEAQEEGNKKAERAFKFAMAVEKIHYDMYGEAMKSLKAGNDLPEKNIFVCPVCGNTVYDGAPDKCEICGVPGEKFFEVN